MGEIFGIQLPVAEVKDLTLGERQPTRVGDARFDTRETAQGKKLTKERQSPVGLPVVAIVVVVVAAAAAAAAAAVVVVQHIMKLSSALALALALGWARENASYTPFSIPQRRRHAFIWKELSSTSPSSSLSSSPHPPDEPPSNDLLNLYYASTPSQMSSDQLQQQQQQQQQTPTQDISTTIETTSIPAKPWMTEEQKEEMNAAANRFVQEVWKPLFESSVQPGVPADTIKGAALVGATLAFLASKGLVVTSAAGLSAAYVAISQGVAGDVLRTMGGIAWDVTETATKLVQMATTTDQMTGISKELVDKVAMAVQETQTRASALQELGDKNNNNNNNNPTSTTVNVQEATEAFLESQDELARVLREAETAIGAADAAIAQAEQTLWQDQLETTTTTTTPTTQAILDLSVPYNAAAKLAYEASDKSRPFEDFELEYIAESIAVVKSKHQASKVLLEQAKQKMEQEKREQEEAAQQKAAQEEKARLAAEQEAKRKTAEEEKARLAAEQEAKRKAAEEETARLAAEQEAKRKAAEEETARLAAELEAKRKAAEAETARLAAELEAKRKAVEAEKARIAAEQEAQRKAAEQEKARLAAELEVKRKAAEEEKLRIAAEQETKRKAAEAEMTRIAAEQETKRKEAEAEKARLAAEQQGKAAFDDEDDDDDDDWLAAVEMAQQGLDGKIVGLEDAIQDESGKARWDAAGALAEELGAFVDEDADDDEYELEDLFDAETLEKLGLAARKAVEAFEEEDEIEEIDGDDDDVVDGVKGIDGMYVASSFGRSSSSSTRRPIQRDWSALTVAKLKDELRFRGLKAYGKKAELVAMLEAYERDEFADGNDDEEEDEDEEDNFLADDVDSEEELFDLGDLDLEELGRQARAAVELGTLGGFDAEEPSDEVLMQLENEESQLLRDFLGDGNNNEKQKQTEKNYSRMTVLELKEELRERGLPLSGKKSELIDRLQETDLS